MAGGLTRPSAFTRAVTIIAALVPGPAAAHPLLPGITGYPALMLHPLLITHQVLAIATAMLLIARSPLLSRWRTLLAFAIALALANALQGFIPALFTYYWIAASALIAIAAFFVAALDPVPPRLALPAITLLGALIGLDIHGEGPGAWARIEAVSAAMLTTTVLLFTVGFLGSYPLPRPLRLAARIAAAWISAATIMILAFALRP